MAPLTRDLNTGESTTTRSNKRVGLLSMLLPAMIVLDVLLSGDIRRILSNNDYEQLSLDYITQFPHRQEQSRLQNLQEERQRQQNHHHEPKDVPYWSAFARQHHKNTTEFDSRLRWKKPQLMNLKRKQIEGVHTQRNAIEILTYGISGALPWYGRILPAVRFDLPYKNTSELEIAIVEGVVDATFDLYQCTDGRKYENQTDPDGYYDVCFTTSAPDGKKIKKKHFEEFCYTKFKRRKQIRRRDYPAPGHERWSCHDQNVMEQLVGAQILDYLVRHYDRFYKEITHNLFFFAEERPIKFVSIDHEAHHRSKFKDFYESKGKNKYEDYVDLKYLLKHDMPLELREEIRSVVWNGTKQDFVDRVNATLQGQLDNLNRVFVDVYRERWTRPKKLPFVTDIIWNRLQGVADYFKIWNMAIE